MSLSYFYHYYVSECLTCGRVMQTAVIAGALPHAGPLRWRCPRCRTVHVEPHTTVLYKRRTVSYGEIP